MARCARSISASVPFRSMPCSIATCELPWITGPSAIGSEKGTPTSTTSAPASSRPCSSASERSRSGCPAVTYGTSALRPVARSVSNRWLSRSGEVVADADAITIRILRLDDGAGAALARRILFGEIDQRAGIDDVAAVVADDADDRSRDHLGDRVGGVHDRELEGVQHDERPDRIDTKQDHERLTDEGVHSPPRLVEHHI